MKRAKSFLFLLFFALLGPLHAQQKQLTYCNPMNLDYGYTPIPNFTEAGKHRATADPVLVTYKGDYYLFSTNQRGYWWSSDLYNWNFVSKSFLKPHHKVYDDLCAPAVFVMGDTMLVFGSTHEKNFPLWMSTNPKGNEWKEAVEPFEVGAWDPAFFLDDDGRLYLYWGSSNVYPLYGIEIDRKTFKPMGEKKELIHLNHEKFGWQRFGEYLDNTFLDPFMEGAWVTKHNGKYYLQYGAPGTEFSGYADGVQVSDHPLGPFKPQPHNPFAYKPGGFARGAGHGNTFQDKWNNWWHVSTMVISVKNNFERRLGVWPAGFDKDGVLYSNTTFGDYPHYLPNGPADHLKSRFTGWMLLNYNKPVTVSSTLAAYAPNYAVDESIKTYWSATTGDKGEWIQTDLGALSTVRAIQLNYADQDAEFLGKQTNTYHQYKIHHSTDGKTWRVLVDKSKNKTDVPH
ncbi:MAG: family 43 glycosylhydrolase, partial [Rufibacter sp.]